MATQLASLADSFMYCSLFFLAFFFPTVKAGPRSELSIWGYRLGDIVRSQLNESDVSSDPRVARDLNRGHYTVARRYEFYFRVAKQYFTNECSE